MKNKTKLIMWVLFVGCAAFILWLSTKYDEKMGKKEQQIIESKAKWEAIEKCNTQWQGQARVPIIGGGYLDATRLRWNASTNIFNKEECGAESFDDNFYWTGEEIYPQYIWLKNFPSGSKRAPDEWVPISALYILGYPKEINDDGTYPAWSQLEFPRQPRGPVAKLEHSRLEVWMSSEEFYRNLKSGSRTISFFFSDWPKDEGPPRRVECMFDWNVNEMSRAEIEQLDRLQQRITCHMDRWNFRFRGGKAEVNITVDSLGQLYPALRALHGYFSVSVMREE